MRGLLHAHVGWLLGGEEYSPAKYAPDVLEDADMQFIASHYLWIIVIGARSAFSYGSAHWFGPQLATWMTTHHVVSGAITDTLLLMALGMLLTRTLGLAARARALPPPAPAPATASRPVHDLAWPWTTTG